MSDALPLPPRPHVDHYKKRAKDLVKACKSGDAEAVRVWLATWLEAVAALQSLTMTAELRAEINRYAEQLDARWRKLAKTAGRAPKCTLAYAQFFIAREHGFASWPKFAKHVDALTRARSPILRFEKAVDAIIAGDAATLARLLREDPALVRARATREHHSTLLHYVSANGVEDFRQKTPKNIVEITRMLLDAGADVDAESTAYGGGATALGLAATSVHPFIAGVQNDLLQLLLDRGATIETGGGSAIAGCLANGRGEAAEFLAARGARLTLEGAAGVGRLDVVKTFFTATGGLKATATKAQMKDGFAWACEYGRTRVVAFLLQRGIDVAERLRHDGQTGLHWAALGGHTDTVRLLLQHGAPVEVVDNTYKTTPLRWAVFGWSVRPPDRRDRYYETVPLLLAAGASVRPEWEKEIRDVRMREALGLGVGRR